MDKSAKYGYNGIVYKVAKNEKASLQLEYTSRDVFGKQSESSSEYKSIKNKASRKIAKSLDGEEKNRT